jgi:hypothetical protein
MKFEVIMMDTSLPRVPRIERERGVHLEGVEDYLRAARSLRIQNIIASMKRFHVMRSVRMLDETAMKKESDPNKGWMGFQVWLDQRPHPIASPEEFVHVSLDCPRLKDTCKITMHWVEAEDLPDDNWCVHCSRGVPGYLHYYGLYMTDRFREFLLSVTAAKLDFWVGDIID